MLSHSTEMELAETLDTLDVGIVILDDGARVIRWNDWMARASGVAEATLLRKKLPDVFPNVSSTRLPNAIQDALDSGSSSILTHTLNKVLPLHNDENAELIHNVVVRPLMGDGPRRCLLQVTDVTVSVVRERVLRDRQNARYHAIVDSAADAIITIDMNRCIQWGNAAAERVFGYDPQELIGMPLASLIEAYADMPALFSESGELQSKGSSLRVVGLSKDGRRGWFEISFARWKADDRNFITTIWRDISDIVAARESLQKSHDELELRVAERTQEREAALNQLHEAQKMETIGQLTGGVAHDFNNLLAIILGSLTLLKKGLPPDPRTARLLDGAIQGAERGATLTKRLLAFARRQELKLEPVDLQKLIPDIMDFLRQSVGPSISIIMDLSPDVHAVKIDANQLELALMNLSVNARDAMPNGGTLTISCANDSLPSNVTPMSASPGDFVRISVADTGEGMSENTVSQAMQPFFTTKGIGKGTGLGLSMVHGLTAQCGGAMNITSKLGKGTVVNLWLPRAESSHGTDVAAPMPTVTRAQTEEALKILLVDDDALVSMNTTYMLSDLGHFVTEASSAANALRLIERGEKFDLVITDFAMPGMNGLDLALQIRAESPRLPIIIATGYVEMPRSEALQFPRLAKPYTHDQLAEVLMKVMKLGVQSR